MVRLRAISKTYYGNAKVLDQVQFELKRGEFAYVLGGSGAGKSTLLRIIATEEPPTQGEISLFGYDLKRVSGATLRAIRRSMGYIPQDVRLVGDLSVYDNIALALKASGNRILTPDLQRRITDLLEVMGLSARRKQMAKVLSGGEAQRVAIARALVKAPELIIADEPTGAQDHQNTWSLMELFVRSNLKGSSVLLATHDREIVRKVRKRCLRLKDHRVVAEDGLCFY